MGPLAPHRQRPAVAETLIARDLDLPLDVLRDVAAEVPLDLEVPVDVVADAHDLLFGEVPDPCAGVDPRAPDDIERPVGPDAVDVAQGHLDPLVTGKIDARDPCHSRSSSPFRLSPVAACGEGCSNRSRGSCPAV